MSKKATEFQKREMSKMYRGKEIFKPLNTGWVDERVACVREWVANIFFYRKGDTTIMIDAGYNYDRLAEKMGWLGIDPQSIRHILITHQDTDHVGAVEADSPGLFRSVKLYIGEIENRYLTGEVRRKVIYHLYKLPQVTINNEKVLLHDGETFEIDGIKIECFLVPGHTWGHRSSAGNAAGLPAILFLHVRRRGVQHYGVLLSLRGCRHAGGGRSLLRQRG